MVAALKLNAISKVYKKFRVIKHALRDISFHVDEGEVFGFVGPNGAGKSTTIKVILDIVRDYEGDILINGVNARLPESRRNVAFVPETPALYEQFTPVEILKMSLQMNGIRRKDETQWCMNWLERFSLEEYKETRLKQLSKGNVQRVALAHAMVVSPKLLVLDEPLSGLDPVGRKDVVNILEEYKKEGGAIFFTSHVLHDVERIADRFGFINDGELLTTRSPRDLMQEHADRFVIRYQSNQASVSDGEKLRDGEFEYELPQHDMPSWIQRLNDEGGSIINIKPAVSLETVFFKILDEHKQNEKGGKQS